MPRYFATLQYISTPLGAFSGLAFYGTMAALIRPELNDASDRIILQLGPTSGSARANIGLDTTSIGKLRCRFGANLVTAPTITCPVADVWQLVAVTKATGTVAPRFHKYLLSTGAVIHEDGATAVADAAALTTGLTLGAGSTSASASVCNIAVLAAWHGTVLTDDQVEQLAQSLRAWWVVQPTGLWVIDQATTTQKVLDQSGGGANESAIGGTTISSAPHCPLGYGHELMVT
jgi:hypothetical protein